MSNKQEVPYYETEEYRERVEARQAQMNKSFFVSVDRPARQRLEPSVEPKTKEPKRRVGGGSRAS